MSSMFEIRTVSINIFLLSATIAIGLLYLSKYHKTYKGFHIWTIAAFVNGFGYLFMGLRHFIPDVFSIIAANSLLIMSWVLVSHGVAVFCGIKMNKWIDITGLIIFLIPFTYFTYFDQNINYRIILVSISISFICFRGAYISYVGPRKVLSEPYLLITYGFSVLAIWSLIRSVVSLVSINRTIDFMQAGSYHGISLSIVACTIVIVYFGLVGLNNFRLSEDLEKLNSMKILLLDVISHDLKNSAGAISTLAGFAIKEVPNNKFLERIKLGSNNLMSIVNDASSLSRVTIGDRIKTEKIIIHQMVGNVVKEYSSALKSKGITLKVKLEENLEIQANPILSQVFSNYISNAIKYAAEGHQITIDQTISDNRYVTFNVKDAGDTIPEEHRKSVFERSLQLDSEQIGRGLGLAIVKRIAEAHNAKVGVKPNIPTGNIFYIRIPLG